MLISAKIKERTGDLKNRYSLGTAQFGMSYGVANASSQIEIPEIKKIINYAKSIGIKSLDTAITYGTSEERLGLIGLDDWKIYTKIPKMPKDCLDPNGWINLMVDSSLNRLGVTNLECVFFHDSSDILNEAGIKEYEALQKLQQGGLINKIGVSIYAPEELDQLTKTYQFDVVQAPCNILDRRIISSGWLGRLKQKQVEVHFRSIFLQGLLLMNKNNRPKYFSRWDKIWSQFDDWLTQSNISYLEACISYINGISEVDKIIIGVNSAVQLKEIIDATGKNVTPIPSSLYTNDIDLLHPYMWR